MKFNYSRLQLKITASLIIFIILPLITINLFLQLHFKDLILKNTNFAFENAVLNVDNTLNNVLQDMGITLNLLSNDTVIYDALENKPDTQKDEIRKKITIDNLSSQYQKKVFYCIVDFLIIDREDQIYSTYYLKDTERLKHQKAEHFLDEILDNNLNYTYFTTTMDTLGSDSDRLVICIGKTIRNYKKELLGQCILIVDEDKIFQLLQKSTLYTDSTNFLIDQNGSIISAADKNIIGTSIDAYLSDKEDHYMLSYDLSNKWNYTALIRYSDLYQDSSYTSWLIILDIVLTLTFIAAILIILNSFLKPIKSLKRLIVKVENGDFTSRFHAASKDELTDLGNCFNHMSENLGVLFEQTQHQQKELLERENEKERFRYMVLQSQINPHLIFNVLNNIKWQAFINNDQPVADAIAGFGRFLEKTLKGKGDNFTIREELEYLQEYLQVMQSHIPQHISLKIQVSSPVLYDCLILKLLLQPIVENSILHGFKGHCTEPRIMIEIRSDEKNLICILSDNGVGMPEHTAGEAPDSRAPEQKLSHSIGLTNTRERLKLFYGESAQLVVESIAGQGTQVTFVLPLKLHQ